MAGDRNILLLMRIREGEADLREISDLVILVRASVGEEPDGAFVAPHERAHWARAEPFAIPVGEHAERDRLHQLPNPIDLGAVLVSHGEVLPERYRFAHMTGLVQSAPIRLLEHFP